MSGSTSKAQRHWSGIRRTVTGGSNGHATASTRFAGIRIQDIFQPPSPREEAPSAARQSVRQIVALLERQGLVQAQAQEADEHVAVPIPPTATRKGHRRHLSLGERPSENEESDFDLNIGFLTRCRYGERRMPLKESARIKGILKAAICVISEMSDEDLMDPTAKLANALWGAQNAVVETPSRVEGFFNHALVNTALLEIPERSHEAQINRLVEVLTNQVAHRIHREDGTGKSVFNRRQRENVKSVLDIYVTDWIDDICRSAMAEAPSAWVSVPMLGAKIALRAGVAAASMGLGSKVGEYLGTGEEWEDEEFVMELVAAVGVTVAYFVIQQISLHAAEKQGQKLREMPLAELVGSLPTQPLPPQAEEATLEWDDGDVLQVDAPPVGDATPGLDVARVVRMHQMVADARDRLKKLGTLKTLGTETIRLGRRGSATASSGPHLSEMVEYSQAVVGTGVSAEPLLDAAALLGPGNAVRPADEEARPVPPADEEVRPDEEALQACCTYLSHCTALLRHEQATDVLWLKRQLHCAQNTPEALDADLQAAAANVQVAVEKSDADTRPLAQQVADLIGIVNDAVRGLNSRAGDMAADIHSLLDFEIDHWLDQKLHEPAWHVASWWLDSIAQSPWEIPPPCADLERMERFLSLTLAAVHAIEDADDLDDLERWLRLVHKIVDGPADLGRRLKFNTVTDALTLGTQSRSTTARLGALGEQLQGAGQLLAGRLAPDQRLRFFAIMDTLVTDWMNKKVEEVTKRPSTGAQIAYATGYTLLREVATAAFAGATWALTNVIRRSANQEEEELDGGAIMVDAGFGAIGVLSVNAVGRIGAWVAKIRAQRLARIELDCDLEGSSSTDGPDEEAQARPPDAPPLAETPPKSSFLPRSMLGGPGRKGVLPDLTARGEDEQAVAAQRPTESKKAARKATVRRPPDGEEEDIVPAPDSEEEYRRMSDAKLAQLASAAAAREPPAAPTHRGDDGSGVSPTVGRKPRVRFKDDLETAQKEARGLEPLAAPKKGRSGLPQWPPAPRAEQESTGGD